MILSELRGAARAETLTTEGVPKAEIEKPSSIYRSGGARALLDRFNG